MNKLELTKCKICNTTTTARGFSQHVKKSHDMSLVDYIVQYEFEGKHPTCKCGCGQQVTIRGYKVMDFIDGHCPSGHFKKGEFRVLNYDSWKKNLTKAVIKYNKEAKSKNPNYRSGGNSNSYGYRHTEETKAKIRKSVKSQIKEGRHPFIGNTLNAIQLKNFENDRFKERLAKHNGFELIVIYDHELDKFICENLLRNELEGKCHKSKDVAKLNVEDEN